MCLLNSIDCIASVNQLDCIRTNRFFHSGFMLIGTLLQLISSKNKGEFSTFVKQDNILLHINVLGIAFIILYNLYAVNNLYEGLKAFLGASALYDGQDRSVTKVSPIYFTSHHLQPALNGYKEIHS